MFTIEDIREKVGGAEGIERVMGLQATIVRRSPNAVAARVGSPLGGEELEAMVSRELAGRCTCDSKAALCDHAAAAALEWILEGAGREPVPAVEAE